MIVALVIIGITVFWVLFFIGVRRQNAEQDKLFDSIREKAGKIEYAELKEDNSTHEATNETTNQKQLINIEDAREILQEHFISKNDNLKFVFAFVTPESGTVNAYDRELGVHIPGEWEFGYLDNELQIVIKGWDGLHNNRSGFVCKMGDVKTALIQQKSAYDLVGE